jgi:integrase/recombinase XerC/integrase/recombinase XerD
MADLLRQQLVGDGWTSLSRAAGMLELPAFAATPKERDSMGQVVRLPSGTTTLQAAVEAFLDQHDLARSTRRVYRASLASLVAGLGPATAVSELSGPMLTGWFRGRYAAAAPATWNRELATVRAAVRWWRRCGWLTADPTDGLERRRERVDRTRALSRGQLERLFARRDLPLRERTLWRLLYETAARANELLALDVEDLDLANRRARVHSKGGAVEWVFWQTGSAQLLPRLLAGRTGGPVFLGGRRPTRAVAALDLDPTSGRARLSYRRAAELFHARTGWTLHQLRHSALTHAAEDGTNLPMLLAAPGTPRCAPWSATPAPDPRRSPATSPRPTRYAADREHHRISGWVAA